MHLDFINTNQLRSLQQHNIAVQYYARVEASNLGP
jgi:hypothetical protein